MFWEDTMEPELAWWQSDWQYYLQGDDGSFVMYDMGNTPAYVKRKMAEADRFQKAFELAAVTVDEYRSILGLDPLPELAEQPAQPADDEPVPEAVDQATDEEPPIDDTPVPSGEAETLKKKPLPSRAANHSGPKPINSPPATKRNLVQRPRPHLPMTNAISQPLSPTAIEKPGDNGQA
jgi:hypothetical protein